MVGRELTEFYTKKKAEIGDIVFEVKDLNVSKKLNNINLNVRKGEILGIAGLVGAGKTEFAETVFGLRKIQKGEIFIEGEKKNMRSPVTAFKNNIGYLTEDRKVYGLNLKGDTRENISIVNLREYDILNLFINLKKETTAVKDIIDTLQIKVPGVSTRVESLSGGNQQKVVIAKWYLLSPDILLMDEPTRGIDIGAKAEIYRIISDLAVSGKAIILISSEMEELISMSDRIIVLHYGSITGVFDRKDFDQEEIMACAAGHMEREEN
jgi:ABC-type sugar transport system ATPase subunit